MSGLESNFKPTFQIAKDEEIQPRSLTAVPLELRKQAVENFDREFRIGAAPSSLRQVDDGVSEYLANAKALYRQHEYELAYDIYKTVLKIDPNNDIAICGLAECAKQFSRHEEAIAVLQSLVEKQSSGESFKTIGDQFYAMEYLEDAMQAYLRAMRVGDLEERKLFEVLKNCGNILLRIGDANGAEEYYNKAYTIDPDSDTLLVNFGSLEMFRGEYDKALNRFRAAAHKNPMNDKAWVGLAMIHREYGDAELAWANVERALDVNPNNESAIRLVADWALKDNELEKAIRLLEIFLNLNPADAQMFMWLAKFYYFMGRLQDAEAMALRALNLDQHIEGGQEVLSVVREEIQARELRK